MTTKGQVKVTVSWGGVGYLRLKEWAQYLSRKDAAILDPSVFTNFLAVHFSSNSPGYTLHAGLNSFRESQYILVITKGQDIACCLIFNFIYFWSNLVSVGYTTTGSPGTAHGVHPLTVTARVGQSVDQSIKFYH